MEKGKDFDSRAFRDSLKAYQGADQVVKDEPALTAEDEARAEGEGMTLPEPQPEPKASRTLVAASNQMDRHGTGAAVSRR